MTDPAQAVLLLTRPLDASRRFLDQVTRAGVRGFRPCLSPLLDIAFLEEPVGPAPVEPMPVRGLILTSGNGVEAAIRGNLRRDVPCHVVGRATAEKTDNAGWRVETVARTADALVEALCQKRPAHPLLHLCGRHRRGDIAVRLTAAGLPARAHVAYDQVPRPFSADARAALQGALPVVAPVFSPRTARHFARELAGTAPVYVAALSPAVAKPLETLPVRSTLCAERPDAGGMISALRMLLDLATRVEGAHDGR